jgi:hypothetical protein
MFESVNGKMHKRVYHGQLSRERGLKGGTYGPASDVKRYTPEQIALYLNTSVQV